MIRQVLVPHEQNATVTIPSEWFGMKVVILAYPITANRKKEKSRPVWLSGHSKMDNPVRIGDNFKKIPRDEIYD